MDALEDLQEFHDLLFSGGNFANIFHNDFMVAIVRGMSIGMTVVVLLYKTIG